MKIFLTLFIFYIINLAYAEDLGAYGKTYNINEPDMIEYIKSKAQAMIDDGQWDKIKQDTIERTKNKINHPDPVIGITHTKVPRTFYFNPQFDLKKDLTDTNGKVIAKAGTYNPLTYKPFPEELIFIDGSDPIQIEWAVKRFTTNTKKTKIILTSGSFMDLDKKYKIWFYYDQNGSYTSKLGITKVPATVNQEGKQIRVDELALENDV